MTKLSQTQLTSARYEALTKGTGLSRDTEGVLLDVLDAAIGYPAPQELYARLRPDLIPAQPEPIGPMTPAATDGPVRVAVCVGHSRANDLGAVAVNKIAEWPYNLEVAEMMATLLDGDREVELFLYTEYEGSDYGSAMRWLAEELEADDINFALEMHFNAATPSAQGFEYLYWHKSKVSGALAQIFQDHHGEVFRSSVDRGVEPLGDEAHERGTLFTSLTHCPAIICEPFFGSHAAESSFHMSEEGKKRLAHHFVDSIREAARRYRLRENFNPDPVARA